LMISAVLWALGLCLTSAADKKAGEEFDKRVNEVNAVAQQPAKMDLVLQRISSETGVPVERLKQQHQKNPNIGLGGLFVANLMADETKKSPENFVAQKAAGKKWVTIAKEHNVSLDKINDRLERLEKAIKG
jgi:hypothetical protein